MASAARPVRRRACFQIRPGGTGLRPVVSGVAPETARRRRPALARANNRWRTPPDEIRRDAGFDGRDARATDLKTPLEVFPAVSNPIGNVLQKLFCRDGVGRRGGGGRNRGGGAGAIRGGGFVGLGLVEFVLLVLGDLFAHRQRRRAVFAVRPIIEPALAVIEECPDEPEHK